MTQPTIRCFQLGRNLSLAALFQETNTMTLSELFSYFGAPFTNTRWSWGAAGLRLRFWSCADRRLSRSVMLA
jgi:hypothetical protein